jgi:hypothetical protein
MVVSWNAGSSVDVIEDEASRKDLPVWTSICDSAFLLPERRVREPKARPHGPAARVGTFVAMRDDKKPAEVVRETDVL